jgi:polyisoprenoid-binding protein YceI
MTQAAQTSPPTTAWRLDPVHTNGEFAVRHLMISTIHGRFGAVSGTAVVPSNDFSRAEIEARVGVPRRRRLRQTLRYATRRLR